MEAPDMRGLEFMVAIVFVFAFLGVLSMIQFLSWAFTHVRISW